MQQTLPARRVMSLLPCEARVLGNRYRVQRLIGRGGVADTYLGEDLLLGREIVLKILHDDLKRYAERFRQAAMTLATLRSRHTVEIYDIRLEPTGVYLVMQHIEGQTIADVARTGSMPEARAESILIQVLDGLAEMHARGLVHRDIKPSNVLVDDKGRVVLLDLGAVCDTRRASLTLRDMIAAATYRGPEAYASTIELAIDVYQVGLLMLFLMTGVEATNRSSCAGFDDLVERLPMALAEVARRALAPDPAERFPSATVMREAVEMALEWSTSADTIPDPELVG